jgi:hypothetical protein
VAKHRHAVVRDLVSLGYRGDSLIDFGDFISIVIASPPMSAVRYAVEGGWSQTDHLLANLHEQQGGFRELPHPYPRPSAVPAERDEPDHVPISLSGSPQLTPQTREEFARRRARDMARGAELAATEKRIA